MAPGGAPTYGNELMHRFHLVIPLSLVAAACAASNPRPQSGLAAVDANGNKIVCRMERPIGSNIAEMVCRTQESVDAQRQAAQSAIQTAPKSGTSPANN